LVPVILDQFILDTSLLGYIFIAIKDVSSSS
jgi:hypothetical protein